MVSIIIVNYNQKEWLGRCLKKIKEAKISLPYEIIIIDNASTDGSKEFLSLLLPSENLIIIENKKNLGFARAVNQGIKKAKGEYLFIINSDVLITPGSLEKMRDFLAKHEEVGLIGPQLTNLGGDTQASCFSFPKWFTPIIHRTFLRHFPFGKKELRRYLMEDFNHQKTREVDWVLGGALMVSKKAIEKVGLMDERFFLYFEDIDWCRRFKEKGFQVIYFPEVFFFHDYQRLSARHQGLMALFDKIVWIHIMSAIKYFWKWR